MFIFFAARNREIYSLVNTMKGLNGEGFYFVVKELKRTFYRILFAHVNAACLHGWAAFCAGTGA